MRLIILVITVLFHAIRVYGIDENAITTFEKNERDNGQCGDNLYWELSEGTLTINGTGEPYRYYQGDWPWYSIRKSITSIVIYEGVLSIGSWAFYDCYKLKDVTIPDSLQVIDIGTFHSCSSITNVKIGNGVGTIWRKAFYNCTNLVYVIVGSNLTSIAYDAFYGCSSLTSFEVEESNTKFSGIDGLLFSDNNTVLVKYPIGRADTNYSIPDHVKEIGNYAFALSKLINVIIPDTVTSIGEYAFSECRNLENVELSNTLQKIDRYAFDCCENLTNISLPDTVTSVGGYAFSECRNLENVKLSNALQKIDDYIFNKCENLVNITIPNSVISIEKCSFMSCSSLMNVKFSKNLESIGNSVFSDCRKLTNITLPKSLKSIGYRALNTNSPHMASIDVVDGNEYFKSIDGVLFDHDFTELIQYPPGKTDVVNYVIPESVKTIRDGAFGYSQLMNVTMPAGIEKLDYYVFEYCQNLKRVIIPEGVQSIGYRTFASCTNLGNITIPQSMKSIEIFAFEGCTSLTSVFYQGNTPISSSALESITSLSDVCTAPGYSSTTFCGAEVTNSSETCKIYRSFFSPCTKGSCVDGVIVKMKWDNVTAWENQTNECEEYHCDGVHGSFVSWWNCNSSDGISRTCVKEKCIETRGLTTWEICLIVIFPLVAIVTAASVMLFICYRKKKSKEIEMPSLKEFLLPLIAESSKSIKTNDEDEDEDDNNYSMMEPEAFRIHARNLSLSDEWSVLLASMKIYEWDCSPVRMFPLTKENETIAEELISSHTCKVNVFESELVVDKSSNSAYNLHFAHLGGQVPVEQDLKQKIVIIASDSQKTSFIIPKRKYPKFRFSAEPSQGTLTKGAMEVELTLRMTCTTSVQLEVPIIFWRGKLMDFEKAMKTRETNTNSYACFFRGTIQSKLSRRLDIEELELYRPPIGSGAFGTVYCGTYRGQKIACKMLKNQDDLTEDMFKDFKTEVNLFDQFRHPCIVKFVGAVWFPGSLAIVTELCKYGSLPSSMKKNPEAWESGMRMKAMYDCACAMNFLHESSIMHRDLKPDNLLVTSLNRADVVCKLSDFGTTKDVAGDMMGDMTQTKGVGTPFFMAPEVMRGGGHYTTQADVYSFGILMASVIDGEQPYIGDTRFNSSWEFTNMVINEQLRPIVKNTDSMPPELIQLMQLCWDGNPVKRPTFSEIMEHIHSLLAADSKLQ